MRLLLSPILSERKSNSANPIGRLLLSPILSERGERVTVEREDKAFREWEEDRRGESRAITMGFRPYLPPMAHQKIIAPIEFLNIGAPIYRKSNCHPSSIGISIGIPIGIPSAFYANH